MKKTMHIKPRFYNRYTDPDRGQREKKCYYANIDWPIPLNRAALICLDIWNMDLHLDMRERDDRITLEKIVPLVAACRKHGLQIIHAPAPLIAQRHPNWVDLVKDGPQSSEHHGLPEWPPADFKNSKGEYTRYAFPGESLMLKSWKILNDADFHEMVRPEKEEPVIASGEELHRLCTKKGILFLLFAGFHTPGCMTGRTYGIVNMQTRGYSCILLRDCTNGMETHETFDEQTSMKGTIAFLEQSGIYTLASEELIGSLKEAEIV